MEDGVHRLTSKKGNGFWLARYKGQEKVFYDGSYGTELSSKQAAYKWYTSLAIDKGQREVNAILTAIMNFVKEKKENCEGKTAKEVLAEVLDMVIEQMPM